jgi:hypothetical protein
MLTAFVPVDAAGVAAAEPADAAVVDEAEATLIFPPLALAVLVMPAYFRHPVLASETDQDFLRHWAYHTVQYYRHCWGCISVAAAAAVAAAVLEDLQHKSWDLAPRPSTERASTAILLLPLLLCMSSLLLQKEPLLVSYLLSCIVYTRCAIASA